MAPLLLPQDGTPESTASGMNPMEASDMKILKVALLALVTLGAFGGCVAGGYVPRPVVVAPAPVVVAPAPVVVAPYVAAPVVVVPEPCYYCRPYYRRW